MKNLFKLSPKTYLLSLLIILAVIGMLKQGFIQTIPQILIAIVTAISLDFILHYIKSKEIIFSSSAFITGMIIALVLSPGINWHIPLVAASIAILQKYIIRFKGRHIFNPANFGLLSVILIFSSHPRWWGESYWPLIIIVGIFICYKMRRFDLPIAFILTFVILNSLNNLFTRQPIQEAFFPLNIFFIFIMLIEPKTSPFTKKGRMVFGILVAALSFLILKIAPQYDFSIFSLAIGNIFAPFLNKFE